MVGFARRYMALLIVTAVILVVAYFFDKEIIALLNGIPNATIRDNTVSIVQSTHDIAVDPIGFVKSYVKDQARLWLDIPNTMNPIERTIVPSPINVPVIDEILSFVLTTNETLARMPAGTPKNIKLAAALGLTTSVEIKRITEDVIKKSKIPCPDGFRNDGSFCAKLMSYGRGVGYVSEVMCKASTPDQLCEKHLLLWYPRCKTGYHNVGCCICSPDCPKDMVDIGVSCAKKI